MNWQTTTIVSDAKVVYINIILLDGRRIKINVRQVIVI